MLNITIDFRKTFRGLKPSPEWAFNDAGRSETNYITHGYHRYPAKFIPNIVKKIIDDYTKPGDIVVDPFGGCGSGVTAEEKFKKLGNGTIVRYVYYHCGRSMRDTECKEPYVREEELITQLLGILDRVDIDKIGLKEKLQFEMERFQKFTKSILGQEGYMQTEISQVNVRNYAKYVLTEGSRDEKRELLSCLKSELKLKDKKIILETKKSSK